MNEKKNRCALWVFHSYLKETKNNQLSIKSKIKINNQSSQKSTIKNKKNKKQNKTINQVENQKSTIKSGTIVIMNKSDYIAEVERQLHNSDYYEKLESDPSEEVKPRISDCIEKLSEQSPNISDVFDTFPSEMRTPQLYILTKTHKEFDEKFASGISWSSDCFRM